MEAGAVVAHVAVAVALLAGAFVVGFERVVLDGHAAGGGEHRFELGEVVESLEPADEHFLAEAVEGSDEVGASDELETELLQDLADESLVEVLLAGDPSARRMPTCSRMPATTLCSRTLAISTSTWLMRSIREEPGMYWEGFVSMKAPFAFILFDLYRTTEVDLFGRPIADTTYARHERLTLLGRDHILGLQGQLWGETITGTDRPRIHALPANDCAGGTCLGRASAVGADRRRGAP